MSVEFLVKLRDGAQMIADACNEQLERQAPKDDKPKSWSWNPDKLQWNKREGEHGQYEKCSEGNQDYRALIDDLKAHNGKLSRDGLFYWLFVDQISVGRKLKRSTP